MKSVLLKKKDCNQFWSVQLSSANQGHTNLQFSSLLGLNISQFVAFVRCFSTVVPIANAAVSPMSLRRRATVFSLWGDSHIKITGLLLGFKRMFSLK